MKTETVVLLAIGGAALAAGLVYYAKQKQKPVQTNPLAAPTNGNPNNNSAPSTAQQVQAYVGAAKDGLSAVEGFFGW